MDLNLFVFDKNCFQRLSGGFVYVYIYFKI